MIWVSISLGLLLLVFIAFFIQVFFHVQKLERLLAETLQEVEIHLLNRYGEISPKKVREVDLDDE